MLVWIFSVGRIFKKGSLAVRRGEHDFVLWGLPALVCPRSLCVDVNIEAVKLLAE